MFLTLLCYSVLAVRSCHRLLQSPLKNWAIRDLKQQLDQSMETKVNFISLKSWFVTLYCKHWTPPHVDWRVRVCPYHYKEWRRLGGCSQEMFPCYLLQVRNKTFLTKTKTKHKHLSCQNFFIEIQKNSCQNFQSPEIW